MSKKFDKKLTEIEDWLDDFSDALDDAGYSVIFHATKLRENDAKEWYSFTGFPVGLVDSLVMTIYMIGEYIGYENLPAFMETLTKYASIKHNVNVNHVADEIAMPQHEAICRSIMETYYNNMQEQVAEYMDPNAVVDELIKDLTDSDE